MGKRTKSRAGKRETAVRAVGEAVAAVEAAKRNARNTRRCTHRASYKEREEKPGGWYRIIKRCVYCDTQIHTTDWMPPFTYQDWAPREKK